MPAPKKTGTTFPGDNTDFLLLTGYDEAFQKRFLLIHLHIHIHRSAVARLVPNPARIWKLLSPQIRPIDMPTVLPCLPDKTSDFPVQLKMPVLLTDDTCFPPPDRCLSLSLHNVIYN